jgi:hypothetical protein
MNDLKFDDEFVLYIDEKLKIVKSENVIDELLKEYKINPPFQFKSNISTKRTEKITPKNIYELSIL